MPDQVVIEATTRPGETGPPRKVVIRANIGRNPVSRMLFRVAVRLHFYREWYRWDREFPAYPGHPGRALLLSRMAVNSTTSWAAAEVEKLTGRDQWVTPADPQAGEPDWGDES